MTKANSQKKILSSKLLEPTHEPKLAREYFFLHPKKQFNFFSPTLRCFIFFAIAQPKTDKHFDNSEHKQKAVQLDTEDRTPSANMGLAKVAVQCFV